MEYLIGVALSIAVAALAALVGFDRERVFYPTILIVIASYYVLFAAMGSNNRAASGRTLEWEIAVATVFLLLAVIGFKTSSWLVVAAMAGHGVFDFVHRFFIENPGVPPWWPGFCMAFDVTLALWLFGRLRITSISVGLSSTGDPARGLSPDSRPFWARLWPRL